MDRSWRWLLIAAIVLLGLGEAAWLGHSSHVRLERFAHDAQLRQQAAIPPPLPDAKPFTRDQVYAFLASAKRAEALADPLQRCIAYPDPPGSHWARDAVLAYCHYLYQPILSFADAQQLIQSGQSAKLDQLLADALKAQQENPDAPGRLDRIYEQDFYNATFDARSTLDAWKRASPRSAFAWVASGDAYVAMAQKARGKNYISNTPQNDIESMDRLLALADADLRHALALDPHVTPTYTAMIDAGTLSLGRSYALDAARRGLAIAPDNFAMRDMLMWMEQPIWYGSLQGMRKLADDAQAHAGRNPLLKLLLPEAGLFEVEHCDCERKAELAGYRAALDQLGRGGFMRRAGYLAGDDRDLATQVVYLSESLRFNQDQDEVRTSRSYGLVDFDEAAWAQAEAGRVIAAAPGNADAFRARANAYESVNDYAHAEKDLQSALAADPDDLPSLGMLGDLYVHWTHQWDKGWDIADRLIEMDPGDLYGWTLRADIQQGQPRPGLRDTADYIEAHFGQEQEVQRLVTRLRAAAALQNPAGQGGAPSAPPG